MMLHDTYFYKSKMNPNTKPQKSVFDDRLVGIYAQKHQHKIR